ncbi:DUF5367 family protein [Sphingobacterium sp. SGR-19]|uniref:DUF5367 family protein n=1 Tax=Sphingobacterium sp. SGR-19 TaxID=2710886 RepID=UPI0013EC7CB4|nr:Loki-CTERM sorting domain-containing protein [Sphingobacterium sp. SGR-19]NGM66818.1 DUF5367 domain-containing protein [Sphingobacterium sp. SGR-19]
MKHFRAISIGAMVWAFIFLTFAVLEFVPAIKDSLNLQMLVVGILIVPYAIFGASIFYRNGNEENGMKVGVIMALTALILDALVTVPLIEIPRGGSYQSFYSFPLLWLLAFINIGTIYVYWRLKNND